MTRVLTAQHPTEAHLVGLLRSGGIEAEVRGEALFTSRGEVPVTPSTLPSVWIIDDALADDARQILEAHASQVRSDVGAGQSWQCANCGETIEPQFTSCWHCEASRPDPPGSDAR